MPDPTLLDALKACAVIFPTGVLTVVGRTDCGLPVSVPFGDGATGEAIAARTRSDDLTAVYRQRDEARAQRDALQARVDTLTAGERLTKDALAAAEKRAEKAEFDRDNAVSSRTSAQHLLKAGKPVAWRADMADGSKRLHWYIVDAEIEAVDGGGKVTPLYESPPLGVDVSEIRTLIEHGKRGCYDLSSFVIILGNMLGKLQNADIGRLRTLAKTVLNSDSVHHVSDEILAAIGEKAVPPSGCVDHGPDGVGC